MKIDKYAGSIIKIIVFCFFLMFFISYEKKDNVDGLCDSCGKHLSESEYTNYTVQDQSKGEFCEECLEKYQLKKLSKEKQQ